MNKTSRLVHVANGIALGYVLQENHNFFMLSTVPYLACHVREENISDKPWELAQQAMDIVVFAGTGKRSEWFEEAIGCQPGLVHGLEATEPGRP